MGQIFSVLVGPDPQKESPDREMPPSSESVGSNTLVNPADRALRTQRLLRLLEGLQSENRESDVDRDSDLKDVVLSSTGGLSKHGGGRLGQYSYDAKND